MLWLLFSIAIHAWAQTPAPAPAPPPAVAFEEERLKQLLTVKRIYVDKLAGQNSDQIRDLVIASLQGAKVFILTENADRADATLRGSAEDLIYTDTFQYNEGASGRGSANATRGTGTNRRGLSGSLGVGENESTRIAERRHEAIATLRLVNKEGDVIWSTTQESRGAKFRGAAADVAEKVARSLMGDYDKARKSPSR